jgi:hypothetical protein
MSEGWAPRQLHHKLLLTSYLFLERIHENGCHLELPITGGDLIVTSLPTRLEKSGSETQSLLSEFTSL